MLSREQGLAEGIAAQCWQILVNLLHHSCLDTQNEWFPKTGAWPGWLLLSLHQGWRGCRKTTCMARKGAHISLGFPACRFLNQPVAVLLLKTLLLGEMTKLHGVLATCRVCCEAGCVSHPIIMCPALVGPAGFS